jgi:hypothetical protein
MNGLGKLCLVVVCGGGSKLEENTESSFIIPLFGFQSKLLSLYVLIKSSS